MQKKVWKMLESMLWNIRMKPEENTQNAEHLTTSLKGSITKVVHTRICQLRNKYHITREPGKDEVDDCVCYLKVIIDCFHCNTRSVTAEVRTQLLRLHKYVTEVARGLCQHTIELLDKLNAAGNTTRKKNCGPTPSPVCESPNCLIQQ